MTRNGLVLAAVLAFALPGAAFSQTTAPAMKPAPAAAATTAAKPAAAAAAAAKPAPADAKPAADAKMAKSKECSAQADKQGLHGKERKAFRDKCKKA